MAQMGVSFGGNPADLRALIASFPRPAGDSVGAVVNRNLPGPAGEVPVRIYTPAGDGPELLPALVWFHGGGWVFGSLDTADFTCRGLANRAGCRVISVGLPPRPGGQVSGGGRRLFRGHQMDCGPCGGAGC